MIDPLERWREYGEKPDYAGLLTFSGMPYTQDAAELDGVDVAIVGAPTDDLVSDRPGTRFGPRAIRAASCPHGPHLEAGHRRHGGPDASSTSATPPVLPADPVRTHAAIETLVGEVVDAGALPIILGGDHSIAEPDIRAIATRRGPVGLIHFDTHTDTGARSSASSSRTARSCTGSSSRGTWTARATSRSACAATGRGRPSSPGSARTASPACSCTTCATAASARSSRQALTVVGAGPVFLSVDVDVLDPAYAPGTGTPEPGGMTIADLLWACREICSRVELVGMDVVEVAPTGGRLGRHHGAGRGPDRPRGHHRGGATPYRLSASAACACGCALPA